MILSVTKTDYSVKLYGFYVRFLGEQNHEGFALLRASLYGFLFFIHTLVKTGTFIETPIENNMLRMHTH